MKTPESEIQLKTYMLTRKYTACPDYMYCILHVFCYCAKVFYLVMDNPILYWYSEAMLLSLSDPFFFL